MAHFSRSTSVLLTLCAVLSGACAENQPAADPDAESLDPSTKDSSGQSYAEAISIVCDADRLAGADANDPVESANQRNDYLVQHVKNADGIYFLTVFRTQIGVEQAEALSREAKVAKLQRCPLADSLRAESAVAPADGATSAATK